LLPPSILPTPPTRQINAALLTAAVSPQSTKSVLLGKFIKSLNYTAPNASIVHVEIDARDGKNAYVNIDSPFTALPAILIGADWVQADNRDALYSAVDLMELAVANHATVWIAHDHRLPPPNWLTIQFKSVSLTMNVAGQAMDLYRHDAKANASLTLGANTENTRLTEGNMYLVFVGAADNIP
jgi:beta-galactosidase